MNCLLNIFFCHPFVYSSSSAQRCQPSLPLALNLRIRRLNVQHGLRLSGSGSRLSQEQLLNQHENDSFRASSLENTCSRVWGPVVSRAFSVSTLPPTFWNSTLEGDPHLSQPFSKATVAGSWRTADREVPHIHHNPGSFRRIHQPRGGREALGKP